MSVTPDNFLALPPGYCDPKTARTLVLPIPYDATTTYKSGSRDGPRAIIEASQQVEWFDEILKRECHGGGVATLDPIEPDARGPQPMHEKIFRAARRIVRNNKFLLALGGEHGISSGLIRAVQSKFRNLSVLQIDAHLDLRNEYQGSPFSHASVMRRVHELGCPIVPVGIRNVSREEHLFCRRQGIDFYSASTCRQGSDWIGEAAARLTENVYVTIDVDGFDPAYAPGTGTPEPGGLDWGQVTSLIYEVARRRRIVGGDIVEVRPIPGQHVTEFLAARLAYKLICYSQM
jgi:agmatinase